MVTAEVVHEHQVVVLDGKSHVVFPALWAQKRVEKENLKSKEAGVQCSASSHNHTLLMQTH